MNSRLATQTLREFIIKGFVLNDEMLKNGRPFGKDYFDELLERIREMRALNHKVMLMEEWVRVVDKFLNYSDQQILTEGKRITHETAIAKADKEYDSFRVRQDAEYLSDFDKFFVKYLSGGPEERKIENEWNSRGVLNPIAFVRGV